MEMELSSLEERERQQAQIAEEQCFGQTMQLLTSAWVSQVLKAAVRLDVLEIIAGAGPGARLSASEIASQMPTNNPHASALLDRMLCLLASHSVLTCSVLGGGEPPERRYGLGPVAKYYVKHQYGAPLAPLLISVQDKVMMHSWYELDGAILEGAMTAFERVHGAPMYEYCARDRRFGDIFYESMLNHTKLWISEILNLEIYKGFENLKSLIDVGGAFGHAIATITSKYPHIKGINFDLPTTIQRAPTNPGVEHRGGNMFESVPQGDAIFMKWILHNWDDDHCLKLLKNCYKALPEDGKVIAVEFIIPDDPGNGNSSTRYTLEVDVLMMTIFGTGARARTEGEFQALATKAGFRGLSFECCVRTLWLMEFYK